MGALWRVSVAVFSVWACGALARGEAMHWKVGIGKAVLTPETPVWLAGYAGTRVPDGKLHDLWAKALVFEDQDGHRAVLVATDQMGIPRGMYESTVRKLKARFGLDRAQVMLAFSHNHCGPRLRGDLVDYYPPDAAQEALVADYTDLAEARIVEAVGKALTDLAPATLSLGEGAAAFAVTPTERPCDRVSARTAACVRELLLLLVAVLSDAFPTEAGNDLSHSPIMSNGWERRDGSPSGFWTSSRNFWTRRT